MLVNTELTDSIYAINVKVIPIVVYSINLCKFSKANWTSWSRPLKGKSDQSSSDKKLYLNREDGGRGLKSIQDVYKETRLRVACYMSKSENMWIQAACRRETLKVENAVMIGAQTTMEEVGMRLKFEDNAIQLDGYRLKRSRNRHGKNSVQKGTKQVRIKTY